MKVISERKRIALVAHDNKKADLLEWARFNLVTLSNHYLFATGTTGDLIARSPTHSFLFRTSGWRPADWSRYR
jgi:methylglyoxal synthase